MSAKVVVAIAIGIFLGGCDDSGSTISDQAESDAESPPTPPSETDKEHAPATTSTPEPPLSPTATAESAKGGLTYQTSRDWWICFVEERQGDSGIVVGMIVAFRDAEQLASVKHGIGADNNGWEGKGGVIVTCDEDWEGAPTLLNMTGLPCCLVNVSTFAAGRQQAIDKTVFRLDGEESWTRLADYLQVVEGESVKVSSTNCTRCWALVPIGRDKCENCGLQVERLPKKEPHGR